MAKAKPIFWMGSSKRDLKAAHKEIQRRFGFALWEVQLGRHPDQAKRLRGFGSGILEIREQYEGDAYRAVYCVRFEKAVYVLHVFKKKSKQGTKTPKPDLALITRRLQAAEADYAEQKKKENPS